MLQNSQIIYGNNENNFGVKNCPLGWNGLICKRILDFDTQYCIL